jgi:hypothetical protein
MYSAMHQVERLASIDIGWTFHEEHAQNAVTPPGGKYVMLSSYCSSVISHTSSCGSAGVNGERSGAVLLGEIHSQLLFVQSVVFVLQCRHKLITELCAVYTL